MTHTHTAHTAATPRRRGASGASPALPIELRAAVAGAGPRSRLWRVYGAFMIGLVFSPTVTFLRTVGI